MEFIVVPLIILFVLLAIVTVVGHALWLAIAAIVRGLSESVSNQAPPVASILTWRCQTCSGEIQGNRDFCGYCGTAKHKDSALQLLRELAVTERQIERLHREQKIPTDVFESLRLVIKAERPRKGEPESTPSRSPEYVEARKPMVVEAEVPPVRPPVVSPATVVRTAFVAPPPPPRPPRRTFSEVLNSFMEESNIRWGEIIGGLLIIGCSTALVVSLWSQISQIPVLKFLIFTTVTAVLFGIGMYTDHRWKLPTTSRGVLTIATLLVPLNFLAIAAVSVSQSSGVLVLSSELLAPAIFLCLVYFAGRIITPGCAHLLAAGVLGSSVGQLLVRHFAGADAPVEVQVLLGAFPVMCYVTTVCLALKRVLADRKIEESEATTIFTVLGTMSFAALLPFGLLLYKSGPMAMSMMYLAPLVTLWGVPLLATGTALWRRIDDKNLVGSRVAGTTLAIIGFAIAVAGMILAWPNPASIVPAALFNFAILTILAVSLEIPVAHCLASGCFSLAYLVFFHVATGHIAWQNWREESLVRTSLDITSGQSLIGTFLIFLIASEWLSVSGNKRTKASGPYLLSASVVGVVSLFSVTVFGPLANNQVESVWIVYCIYFCGASWIAWRKKLVGYTWAAAALFLFTLATLFSWTVQISFPWQTALLVHSTVCSLAAIALSRQKNLENIWQPLNYAALTSLLLAVVSFFQTNPWQVTSMQAERVFWIALILVVSLWHNRHQLLFVALQVALTATAILTVKAYLQQVDWYTYLPHASLHPAALQIQGTVLALLSLLWIAVRFAMKRLARDREDLAGLWNLFDTKYSIDRAIPWVLLACFVLLTVYGALSGLSWQLGLSELESGGWNVAGFPHHEVFSIGSWIALGLLTLVMLANVWERRRVVYLFGALTALSTAIPLIAGQFETQLATATAWRFLAATFLSAGSVLIWKRTQFARMLKSLGWPTLETDVETTGKWSRAALISITFVPLFLLTLYSALLSIFSTPVKIPLSGPFALLNSDLSYSIPLLVVALVFIGYAIRERLPEFNFYAGLLFNVTVTLVYLLSVVSMKAPLDGIVLVRLLQLNAITFSVSTFVWSTLRTSWFRALEVKSKQVDSILKLLFGQAAGLLLATVGALAGMLILANEPGSATLAGGSSLGWFALAATVACGAALSRTLRSRIPITPIAVVLGSVVCLVAFHFADWESSIALCVLTIGTVGAAYLMFALSFLPEFKLSQLELLVRLDDEWSNKSLGLAAIIGVVATVLSFRLLPVIGPQRAWWSVGPLIFLSALAAVLQFRTLRRRYLYAAGFLLNAAISIWWTSITAIETIPSFLELNILTACVAAVPLLFLELRARRLRDSKAVQLSYHNVVAIGSLVLLGLLAIVRASFPWASQLTWPTVGATFALMIAVLWDRHAKYATAGIYLIGIISGAIFLEDLKLQPDKQIWSAMMFLAAFTLVTSLLWRQRHYLLDFAVRLGIIPRLESGTSNVKWLVVLNSLSVATVAITGCWVVLRFSSFEERLAAALAIMVQSLSFSFLAEGKLRERLRQVAIASLVIGLVLAGWSWLTPGLDGTWLNRSVILMLEAFGLTIFYSLVLNKVRGIYFDWTTTIKTCVPAVLVSGAIALLFCLITEVAYQLEFGAVRIQPLSLLAIGATLVAAVIVPVLFALSPRHDPLSLNERGRMNYVYAAELMLALLFVHLRLTMPWLFHGFFEDYWPLVLMAIAYLGVVSSELLRRRDVFVIAQPLDRTGAFLPLVPVIGFWIASSQVDYSLLLFIFGGLYGLLSVLRKSFVFGALAAISGNAGLWYLLHRTDDYQFLQHPQLWLVPVALLTLLAAYLNEDRLEQDQMAGIRYLSLITIYASSTADIFINGVANSPWLPLILGAFSLAGVFSGIMFKIRGLLLLGSVFLLLSIMTMIWYASANFGWTWLWYVAGIATGATIIFMFAVFEKKRGEVLRVVEGLKDWEV